MEGVSFNSTTSSFPPSQVAEVGLDVSLNPPPVMDQVLLEVQLPSLEQILWIPHFFLKGCDRSILSHPEFRDFTMSVDDLNPELQMRILKLVNEKMFKSHAAAILRLDRAERLRPDGSFEIDIRLLNESGDFQIRRHADPVQVLPRDPNLSMINDLSRSDVNSPDVNWNNFIIHPKDAETFFYNLQMQNGKAAVNDEGEPIFSQPRFRNPQILCDERIQKCALTKNIDLYVRSAFYQREAQNPDFQAYQRGETYNPFYWGYKHVSIEEVHFIYDKKIEYYQTVFDIKTAESDEKIELKKKLKKILSVFAYTVPVLNDTVLHPSSIPLDPSSLPSQFLHYIGVAIENTIQWIYGVIYSFLNLFNSRTASI